MVRGIRVEISDKGSGVNAGADLRLPSQLDLLGTARARESFLIPARASHQREDQKQAKNWRDRGRPRMQKGRMERRENAMGRAETEGEREGRRVQRRVGEVVIGSIVLEEFVALNVLLHVVVMGNRAARRSSKRRGDKEEEEERTKGQRGERHGLGEITTPQQTWPRQKREEEKEEAEQTEHD